MTPSVSPNLCTVPTPHCADPLPAFLPSCPLGVRGAQPLFFRFPKVLYGEPESVVSEPPATGPGLPPSVPGAPGNRSAPLPHPMSPSALGDGCQRQDLQPSPESSVLLWILGCQLTCTHACGVPTAVLGPGHQRPPLSPHGSRLNAEGYRTSHPLWRV